MTGERARKHSSSWKGCKAGHHHLDTVASAPKFSKLATNIR